MATDLETQDLTLRGLTNAKMYDCELCINVYELSGTLLKDLF